ncbi:MAG: flagellar biosynthesis repressor FlbT [Alphaproteobacteria bacterium]|nr:flagellar biosynthesis repressor FlbT [Alphaproteobacteria bacterium]
MKSETAVVSSIRVPVRSGDKFVVNGAVLTLTEGAVEIQNSEVVLHGRDVMLPEDANTPAKRIYYWLMLMYLDAPGRDSYRLRLLDDMNDFLNATTLVDVTKSLGLIHQLIQNDDYQPAMIAARALMAFESELLRHPAKAAA